MRDFWRESSIASVADIWRQSSVATAIVRLQTWRTTVSTDFSRQITPAPVRSGASVRTINTLETGALSDLVDYIFSDPLVECTIPDVETEESDAASSEKDESRESTEETAGTSEVVSLWTLATCGLPLSGFCFSFPERHRHRRFLRVLPGLHGTGFERHDVGNIPHAASTSAASSSWGDERLHPNPWIQQEALLAGSLADLCRRSLDHEYKAAAGTLLLSTP